ncbi:MAG: glucose 1-dehydrogenase [Dehalococcoidia bacterium]|nr:glucose 1-dehydrogenase [Dehalococcoidia bacterium]MDZ4246658.1 glucose 1-dehydrogenase [Dehalococcoidia bacterium]
MRLQDKVMVVTGGASGIGQATAFLCAREGAQVVILDIDEAGGRDTERRIIDEGGQGMFLRHDVTREADWQNLVDLADKRFGRIDILFNNAGSNLMKPVTEVTEQEWDTLMALNLKGVFFGIKHVIPLMIKGMAGSIINTASTFGLIGNPNMPVYCASKGGIIALTKQVALDYGKHNIRVNCICPGPTLTPRIKKYIDQGFTKADSMVSRIPMGRAAEPDEIARVVLFLASDDSSYVNGAVQVIDGGRLTN